MLAARGVVQAETYLTVGETIRPVRLDGDRRGYVIATAPTSVEALQRAEYAAGLLEPVAHRGMTVTRTDDGFTLSLPLPLVSASDVGLQRRDDELLVAVGDHRRVLTLPAALQRCEVRGASVRGGLLKVRFVPDPEVWPRG